MPKLRSKDAKDWPKPTVYDLALKCQEIRNSKTWIASRDAALVSALAMFGKRSAEVVQVKKKDIWITDSDLFVRFKILKTTKPALLQCQCGEKNRATWKHCKTCGQSLKDALLIEPTRAVEEATKLRQLNHPLAPFLLEWWKEIPGPDDYVFPINPIPGVFGVAPNPDWHHHLNRRGAGNILRKYDLPYWPHLFRALLATNFSESGFAEFELMDWFDWTRYETAHHYVKMGGGKRIRDMGRTGI